MPSVRPATDFVVRDRAVYERGLRSESIRPILLPFGSLPETRKGMFLGVERSADGKNDRVVAKESRSGPEVTILPPYRKIVRIKVRKRAIDVEVWVVASDSERAQSVQVILGSHYLASPARGQAILARFVRRRRVAQ